MLAFVVDPDSLVSFATSVLERVGVPSADAALVSDSLVTADLWGHQSHGVLRLSWYYHRIRHGVMNPVTTPTVVSETSAIRVLDGHDGIGQVLADRAISDAVALSKRHGVGAVGVRNSNHFGTAAYFTRKAARQGAVAFLSTNASPAMAPWGGLKKSIGANPWSWAAPGGTSGPVVMDVSNTRVARGKIYLARNRGEAIPTGWAQSSAGKHTTDPQTAIDGLILPMAEHKGYVIALMMDVLSGVLTGSEFGERVGGPYQYERRSGAGHFAIAIDIEAFMPVAAFTARVEQLLNEIAMSPRPDGGEPVTYPGEREDRARLDNAAELTLPAQTLLDLDELAKNTDLAPLDRLTSDIEVEVDA